MEDVLDRFDVGTSANQAHVAMVAFSTTTQIDFPLDRHFTTAAAKAGVQASVYNGGITCTGGAMRLVSDQILCAGCPGRRANTPGKRACARACVCVCVREERYICACALCLTLTSRFEPSPSRSHRADPDGRKPVKRRKLPELRWSAKYGSHRRDHSAQGSRESHYSRGHRLQYCDAVPYLVGEGHASAGIHPDLVQQPRWSSRRPRDRGLPDPSPFEGTHAAADEEAHATTDQGSHQEAHQAADSASI
jgi:hypothetical protein